MGIYKESPINIAEIPILRNGSMRALFPDPPTFLERRASMRNISKIVEIEPASAIDQTPKCSAFIKNKESKTPTAIVAKFTLTGVIVSLRAKNDLVNKYVALCAKIERLKTPKVYEVKIVASQGNLAAP